MIGQSNRSDLGSFDNLQLRARRGFLVGLFSAILFGVSTVLSVLFLDFELGAWFILIPTVAMVAASLMAMWLCRRGKTTQGMMLLLLVYAVAQLVYSATVQGLGLLNGVGAVIVISAIATNTLPSKQSGRLIIAGMILGIAGFLVDTFGQYERPVFVNFPILVYIVIIIGILVYLFFIFRRFNQYNLNTKLLISVLFMVGATVLGITLVVSNTVRTALQTQVGENFAELAVTHLDLVDNFFLQKVGQLRVLGINSNVQDAILAQNAQYSGSDVENLELILELDQQWINAQDNDPLIQRVISADKDISPAGGEMSDFQANHYDHGELILTDRYGATVAATNRISDYYQGDEEWWQSAWNDGQGALYISDPEYDESAGVTASLIVVPVFLDETGELVGILRSTLVLDSLYGLLSFSTIGETGHIVLFDRDGLIIFDPRADGEDSAGLPVETIQILIGVEQHLEDETHGEEAHYDIVVDQHGHELIVGHATRELPEEGGHLHAAYYSEVEEAIVDQVAELGWTAIVRQDSDEAYAGVENVVRSVSLVGVLAFAITAIVTAGLAQFLVRPLIALADVTREFTEGNLYVRARVNSQDEIGELALTFNEMASQLQETLAGLEQRVAERTRALETSTEVSRRLSTILDQRDLVREVVEQVQSAFSYYHAHIYLFDEKKENLVMVGGTGDAGQIMLERNHMVIKGRGLVGRAADTNLPVLVPDVTQAEGWLPNPLLPETKAEIAVPIAIGENVLGVLDVQENKVGGLSEADVDLLQSLANQVAIAIQNARAYQQAQRQADREALIGQINQQIQSATSVDQALQVTARELGRVLGMDAMVKLNKVDPSRE